MPRLCVFSLLLTMAAPVAATAQDALIEPPAAGDAAIAADLNEGDSTSVAKELSQAFRDAAARLSPSVVVVLGKRSDVNETLDALNLLDETKDNYSVGSGVIVRSDGWVVTNNHVIADCSEIHVRLADGREYVASEPKTDPSSDLAVVKIDPPTPLVAAAMGDSAELAVGDWVIAIGSPFLLEQTVSAGIVNSKSRSLGSSVAGQLLQTDASINPGNSGGALANLDGELVGINTAIATNTGSFQGVGFAIPSSRVQWVVGELLERGSVRRAFLGVTAVEIPPTLAAQLDLPTRNAGAYVARVRDGSPADKASIRSGDILLQVGDLPVRNPQGLLSIIEQSPVDQPLSVQLIRDGQRVEVELGLEARE